MSKETATVVCTIKSVLRQYDDASKKNQVRLELNNLRFTMPYQQSYLHGITWRNANYIVLQLHKQALRAMTDIVLDESTEEITTEDICRLQYLMLGKDYTFNFKLDPIE